MKAVELSERYRTRLLAVRPWCSVDARLGAATVALTETTVFDGDVHASDACDDTIGTCTKADVTASAVSRLNCYVFRMAAVQSCRVRGFAKLYLI